MDASRTARLTKLLDTVLYGKQSVTPQNATLFLEAIVVQQDRTSCLSKIIASKCGLDSLQSTLRFTLTPDFFNGPCAQFLIYLQSPELKEVAGGLFLGEVLTKIIDPPIFWDSFRRAFTTGQLGREAQLSFGWLLYFLVLLPAPKSDIFRTQAAEVLDTIHTSSDAALRTFGQKIKHVLETCSPGTVLKGEPGPGGRHDNDFIDFRQIAILPTADEIRSSEPPFLRRSSVVALDPEPSRLATHLDNQFRLLREDMLYEMREELQIAFKKKKGYHRGLAISGLVLKDLHYGPDNRRTKWGITLQCRDDLPQLKDAKDRKKFLTDHRNFLRHQSLACLIIDDEIVAFPNINRDEDLLAKRPPNLVVQIEGEMTVTRTLLKLKTAADVKLIQIDTAVFSYEPVLKALQQTNTMPLAPELLLWKPETSISEVHSQPRNLVQTLRQDPRHDLQGLLGTAKSIKLDESQAASLISGLTQKVSLIQGPPGTGKSFIGSLIAKALHDFTSQTILVVCYTNHALDDILTSLLDIGIPEASMVRLGGKSTPRTEPLTIQRQKSTFRRDKGGWAIIDGLKVSSGVFSQDLQKRFGTFVKSNVSLKDIKELLEFEAPSFYAAFQVPESADGSTRVGKKGKVIDEFYLLREWAAGRKAGIFANHPSIKQASQIWAMSLQSRKELIAKWTETLYKEQVDGIYNIADAYNRCHDNLNRHWAEKDTEILRAKRIIGCTTTAAAKYSENIQAASPDILLVEEAGEILESHVLTALGSKTSQLILIGDHKQLRPKVNNYELTVEKDEGYDLNMSIFERLILKGYPHAKLTEQHRMRPEISALIRALTYPELVDAPKTQNRPDLRGTQDNIIFINHNEPEDSSELSDRKDGGSTSSKQNSYEVAMVLKILKYLGQQGYRTDNIVILTPYLGQLQKLQQALKKDNDPVLNDLDSFDLVRAGLVPAATAKMKKQPIRLATIDNYQGEESDIVIASLTRSNAQNDIGFMFSPERLNVLLSRARNALIMIGNSKTFMNSRKGGELWRLLFGLLKDGKHIYEGMPVRCERHQDRAALLRKPEDFDENCPDGGCVEPCDTMLSCGKHPCPSKCHQLYDHSKMSCLQVIRSQCTSGHQLSWKCHQNNPPVCAKCERAAAIAQKKAEKDYELQQKRDAEQLAHIRKMADIEEAITQQDQLMKDSQLAAERSAAILQKEKDLEAAISRAKNPPRLNKVSPILSNQQNAMVTQNDSTKSDLKVESKSVPPLSSQGNQTSPTNTAGLPSDWYLKPSESEKEWERQKNVEGVSNPHVDAIMNMTGLEEVKEQVLTIKALIGTKKRQGIQFNRERLNIALLGNPGTGKTTVARSYGKLLASLQAIPGDAFIETTGSRLANDGVAGIKKQVEQVINAGGGTIFVDEAYQLTSKQNFQGGPVLDFLLAEMENNVGTIVFIVAGYNKEMESFFEHNPGLTSRVPYKIHFADYTNPELLYMFKKMLEAKFSGTLRIEGGIDGLYTRVAIRRLGRGRGTNGFGNARALQNTIDAILRRQAKRLNELRKQGQRPDDLLLCQSDLIGPDPSMARSQSRAWNKLQEMIGLKAVKATVRSLMEIIDGNYQRELQEREPIQISLNRVFLGSPGTGKTTVAKLYGQILVDLGLLSNGEVVVKNPADFIGAFLGESETKTKQILASTAGKVLVIDEAYMLYGGGAGTGGKSSDQFRTAVIDTLVAEIQSVPGEDRCVLLLGYKEQMEEMFQNVNPGLARRFAIEDAFNFEDFDDRQLLEILNLKLKDQHLSATDPAKLVAIQVLDRLRNRPNFGNAGEVENLLSQAKARYYQSRKNPNQVDIVFEAQDFDPEHDRGDRASTNLSKLFEDVVGCEEIVQKLTGYQQLAQALKKRGIEDRSQIPTNFVFKGPPGTGKTTVARKMGQVYYDMGFLSSKEVIECSASDLVGQYIGHTGPKTKKLLEKSLGRVLFIDEAYRLGEGHFAKEAIDELVAALTLDKFKSKIIVILAGYDQDMNNLLAVNAGLASRFPEEIHFRNMEPSRCLEVLQRELARKNVHLPELDLPASEGYIHMFNLIHDLSILPSWGNARDMIQLSKKMIQIALLAAMTQGAPNETPMTISVADAINCIDEMYNSQQQRSRASATPKSKTNDYPQFSPPRQPPAITPNATRTQSKTEKAPAPPQPPVEEITDMNANPDEEMQTAVAKRDKGVTDEVWNQLQACIQAEKEREEEIKQEAERLRILVKEQIEMARQQQLLAEKIARAAAKDAAEREELKRQREQARLKQLEALQEQRRLAAALEERRRVEEERRKKEAKAQSALRAMGVCVAGFRWINMGSGYRCAGGSHFVSNAHLGI